MAHCWSGHKEEEEEDTTGEPVVVTADDSTRDHSRCGEKQWRLETVVGVELLGVKCLVYLISKEVGQQISSQSV